MTPEELLYSFGASNTANPFWVNRGENWLSIKFTCPKNQVEYEVRETLRKWLRPGDSYEVLYDT